MSVERPTMKDVYDAVSGLEEKIDKKLEGIPNRREMRLTIALAVVTGSGVGSIVTALVTHLSPSEQIQAAIHLFTQL